MTGVFLSLYRGPLPPIVWRPCCPQSVHHLLAASPCKRLSLSRSTPSQSDCPQVVRPSSLHRLVQPYTLALSSAPREPAGSPLFPYTPLHACCGYAPRKHSPASHSRLRWFCLPRRGRRVGCFTIVPFRGYFSHSLVFRPTCSLSTLRRARYRTRRKTRYLTARYALSGPSLQTAGLYVYGLDNIGANT